MPVWGFALLDSGVKDVDDVILRNISSRAADGISPRVFPGYDILFWFAKKVF